MRRPISPKMEKEETIRGDSGPTYIYIEKPRSQQEKTSDLRKWEKGGKGAGYNPWELWSDPCGAQLAPGLKPLRWPRAQLTLAE